MYADEFERPSKKERSETPLGPAGNLHSLICSRIEIERSLRSLATDRLIGPNTARSLGRVPASPHDANSS